MAQEKILASKLIEELENGSYSAKVVDAGDLYPEYNRTELKIAKNGRCSITGYCIYQEDTPTHGIDSGEASCDVLGVCFSRSVLESCDSGIDISGAEIEYDDDLTEDDVLEAANENIDWPDYDQDSYSLEEDNVTDEDIIATLDDALCDLDECYGFAKDKNGDVFAFEKEDYDTEEYDVPKGYVKIDDEEAFAILAKRRPGFSLEEDW